ncbi:MAG TPA: exo-alpha-sialidase, partial [Candidatus Fraserbacteria bacterium]|nr:exo-alpha-sialidase [Candidatus Fraserbacteria bacterium]
MKIVRAMMLSLVLLSLGMIGWAQADPGSAGQLPGDHYRWLLNSPVRPYLSSAAEQFLWLKYDKALTELRQSDGLGGLDQRVNDRAQDKNPSRTTQSETAISVFGPNVVIGWNDVGQFSSTHSLTGYGYSADGGNRFSDGGVVPPVKRGANLGDPDIAVDSAGNFYFAQISLNDKGIAFIGVAKSTDGGQSWSLPVNASPGVSGPDSFQDKEFITADHSGGRYDGNVYVSWTRFTRQGGRITFARSTDGGRHFQKPITLSPRGRFVQGSIPRVGPNGEVYVAWQEFNHPGIRISKSSDGGRSFGADGVQDTLVAPIEFTGQRASPATCQGRRILNGFIDAASEFPSLGVNPLNGEIYLAFASNPLGPDQSDVYFVRSSDGGRSWSVPVRLNDDSSQSDQFMPALAVAPNGAIGVIWYDRRSDPRNLKLDVYMALSTDGGRSWQPNRQVNQVSFGVPPLGPNFDSVRPCYMGDYIDITADAQRFYLTWGDNRDRGLTWKSL